MFINLTSPPSIVEDINFIILWLVEIADKSYSKDFVHNIQRDYDEISRCNSPFLKNKIYEIKVTKFLQDYKNFTSLGFLTREEKDI